MTLEDPTPVIDLTASPDEPGCQHGGGRKKRQPVDLVAEEEGARQRIMRHARQVNQERGINDRPLAGERQTWGGASCTAAAAAAGLCSALPNEPAAPAAGAPTEQGGVSNKLLAALHAERVARLSQHQAQGQLPTQRRHPQADHGTQQQAPQQAPFTGNLAAARSQQEQQQQQEQPELSILTWNVWFMEDVHVAQRMAAIGAIIQANQPHFVCLQEVTPLIYGLFCCSPWWDRYTASPCPAGVQYFTVLLWHRSVGSVRGCDQLPFSNSVMGRDLKSVAGTLGGWPVRVATTHLESPTSWDNTFSAQRVAQCKQSLAVLDRAPEGDVLVAGDMNWNPDDGAPPLPGGWSDAWLHLHDGDPGLTYSSRANPMLRKSRIHRRLDRVFVKLRRWRLHSMELLGQQALPGLQFEGRPVLPSDHFGLLLRLAPNESA